MALAEAILVCLTERPMTGYELAKTFDTSIGFFWRASHQQIYRELRLLRSERLVDSKEVLQSGRPNKTVHTITKRGRERIRTWSRETSDRPALRDNMLVKLYALDQVDLDALKNEIADRLLKHRTRLQIYERILAKRYSGRRMGLHQTGWLLGLRIGLTIERGYVGWCEDALATLAALPASDAAPARPARKRTATRQRA